jgi:magnesium transporter
MEPLRPSQGFFVANHFTEEPMLTIYKSTENGLQILSQPVDGCWINLVDPTTEEIEEVVGLGIPQDFVTYPLDLDERSRTEREDDGTLFILMRMPYYQGEGVDIPYNTIPLGMVIHENYFVTISKLPTDILNDFTIGKVKNWSTGKRIRFVLRILLVAANKYLTYLREINKNVDILEDQLTLSSRNKEILEILKYQKSLVYFTTALKSNELVLNRLQNTRLFRMYPEDEDLLEDVITENQQAIEMINIANNILSSMMDAFASIISNNLNVVMKFLTSITIVFSIPTIVTSFFGMNVTLPFAQLPWAYLIIIAIFTGLAGLVIGIFIKRDWF